MKLIVEDTTQQSSTWEKHYYAQFRRMFDVWLWFCYHSGLKRLKHPVPLSEDSLTGSSPLSWSKSDGTGMVCRVLKKNLQCQCWVLKKEPWYVWPYPHLFRQRVHVRDVVHLQWVAFWACKPNREANKEITDDTGKAYINQSKLRDFVKH